MQNHRLSTRQGSIRPIRRRDRRSFVSVRRQQFAAEARGATERDPIVAAAYLALSARLAELAGRSWARARGWSR